MSNSYKLGPDINVSSAGMIPCNGDKSYIYIQPIYIFDRFT